MNIPKANEEDLCAEMYKALVGIRDYISIGIQIGTSNTPLSDKVAIEMLNEIIEKAEGKS